MDTITVNGYASRELIASGATFCIRIAGQSFFVGSQAMTKAEEVKNFVARLSDLGLDESCMRLWDVAVQNEVRLLTKASAATYDLAIRCDSLEILNAALSKTAEQKKAGLKSIAWQYRDLDNAKSLVLRESVKDARDAAVQVADALGLELGSVHELTCETSGLDTQLVVPGRETGLS